MPEVLLDGRGMEVMRLVAEDGLWEKGAVRTDIPRTRLSELLLNMGKGRSRDCCCACCCCGRILPVSY